MCDSSRTHITDMLLILLPHTQRYMRQYEERMRQEEEYYPRMEEDGGRGRGPVRPTVNREVNLDDPEPAKVVDPDAPQAVLPQSHHVPKRMRCVAKHRCFCLFVQRWWEWWRWWWWHKVVVSGGRWVGDWLMLEIVALFDDVHVCLC